MATKKIRRLLIANRGAIVGRIARTCRQLGIIPIGVYSEADKASSYLREVDEAFFLGPAPASQSYLNQPAVLAVAKKAQVDGIHPGYGFLAENPDFAQACIEAGLIWVGPPVEAMRQMGTKKEAKYLVSSMGLPVVPGAELEMDEKSAVDGAKKVGFPLLIKASAGGGGKGMRLVESPEEFPEAWAAAAREAKESFGDGTLLVEKYFPHAKHIEIQILADTYGNLVHLGERECSLQRRHQKIIEESPSPAMSDEMRFQMGTWALKIAKAINYVGVGTIEFIADMSKGKISSKNFYFLEMNTRLQVEHGVTEEIYGIDLVKEQIRVAEGEMGGWQPGRLKADGHSIQCRLYAEDPSQGFLPQSGELADIFLRRSPGVRWEPGFLKGDLVGSEYDPMLAKVITSGEDREEARHRMLQTLRGSCFLGLVTNQAFLISLLEQEDFVKGTYLTEQAGGEWQQQFSQRQLAEVEIVAGIVCRSVIRKSTLPVWGQLGAGWSNMPEQVQKEVLITPSGEDLVVRYWTDETGQYHIDWGEGEQVVSVIDHRSYRMRLEISGRQWRIRFFDQANGTHVHALGREPEWLKWRSRVARVDLEATAGMVRPPTSGKVIQVLIRAGDQVKKGDPLLVLESMKMETSVFAERDGKVEEVFVTAGDVVQSDSQLLRLDEEEK